MEVGGALDLLLFPPPPTEPLLLPPQLFLLPINNKRKKKKSILDSTEPGGQQGALQRMYHGLNQVFSHGARRGGRGSLSNGCSPATHTRELEDGERKKKLYSFQENLFV